MTAARGEGPGLPTIRSLDELAELVAGEVDVYVRWSDGPEADQDSGSRDELTDLELPGLSVTSLAVEPWWDGRPVRLWVARRLYDYHHLQGRRQGTRPWVLRGRERARGPDNDPLVDEVEPLAWIAPEVADEAATIIESIDDRWRPLRRSDD